jgi:hypothetical protein
MAIVIGFGGIGKMVSNRAARVHAPETCSPISTVALLPAERSLQRLHWRSSLYGDGDRDGNDSTGLKAERKHARGCHRSLQKTATLI